MSSVEEQPQSSENGHRKPRPEVRAEVLELDLQRRKIENEIKEFHEILRTQGVGMHDPLVDNEGYPRNDIDINQIRLARNKIICLNTDIQNIFKKIEQKLEDYFVTE